MICVQSSLTDLLPHRKFFGKQDGVKSAPPKQSKLSFSTKSGNVPKQVQAEEDDDVTMPDVIGEDNKKAKKEEEVSSKENIKPELESPNGKGRLRYRY